MNDMTITDEILMAFADGELAGADRDAVERAIAIDPVMARRVADHRALRLRLQEAFTDDLIEPVPESLIRAAKQASPPSTASVIYLKDARNTPQRSPRASTWAQWRVGSLAASLLLGLGLGYLAFTARPDSLVREADGILVATGKLADALSHRLGADPRDNATVQVGVSFLARSGEYCRTFSTSGKSVSSGLACRAGRDWKIEALVHSAEADVQTGAFRTASTTISPLVLQMVEAQIVGEPLDQRAEDAAKRKDWASAPRR